MESMQNLIGSFVILLGLAVGSFLNVVIYRIPNRVSIVRGSSFCTSCLEELSWTEMIPVFSYLFLGGKCRHCSASISFRYPVVELLNSLCYLLIYLTFGLNIVTIIYCVVASCLISLSMIDIDTREIPDRFNLIILVCGVLAHFFSDSGVDFSARLIGLFCISVPMFGIALLTDGIGEGDIKLFAVCGFLLGWRLILLVMLFSSIIAAIYGIILLAVKKVEGKSQIAFGPFISLSVIISMLYGESIISWYFNFIANLV